MDFPIENRDGCVQPVRVIAEIIVKRGVIYSDFVFVVLQLATYMYSVSTDKKAFLLSSDGHILNLN